MNNTRKKRWIEKHPQTSFIVFLVISIIVLDLISAALFIPYDYNSFRCPNPYFHHGLIPYQATKNKWGDREFDIYTNSLGFKDEACKTIALKSDRKRILFMGDSFTEGVGMSWEESFLGILDKNLSDVEILNAGVVSYSPKLHYLKLKYLIENVSLKFDEVYILIDNSDIMDEITYADFMPYYDNSLKKTTYKLRRYFFKNSYIYYTISYYINKNRRNPIAESWNPFSGQSIVDESAVQDDDFIAATLDWSYTIEKYEKWGKKGLELATQNLDKIYELCQSNHIRINLVIYPWPNLIQRHDLDNIQVQYWEEYCSRKNIYLLNLYPAFINGGISAEVINRYFIPGDVHWNKEGNKYIALLLKEFIVP